MANQYVCYNRDFYLADKVPISFNNRAFKYGDAFFETIRCNGHFPLYLSFHYARMRRAMLSLKMDLASLPTESEWEDLINKLLKKNNYYGASRVRIEVFRAGEGLYTPNTNGVCFVLESTPISSMQYQLNDKGILMGDFKEITKQYNPLSFHKSGNALPYVLAAMAKSEQKVEDCFLWNNEDRIIEASSSNVFWFKNEVLHTISVYSGCVEGVMRKVIMELVKNQNWCHFVEVRGVEPDELLEADEIFLTNAIQGIQWVVGYKDRRFFNYQTKKLIALLNEHTFGKD